MMPKYDTLPRHVVWFVMQQRLFLIRPIPSVLNTLDLTKDHPLFSNPHSQSSTLLFSSCEIPRFSRQAEEKLRKRHSDFDKSVPEPLWDKAVKCYSYYTESEIHLRHFFVTFTLMMSHFGELGHIVCWCQEASVVWSMVSMDIFNIIGKNVACLPTVLLLHDDSLLNLL